MILSNEETQNDSLASYLKQLKLSAISTHFTRDKFVQGRTSMGSIRLDRRIQLAIALILIGLAFVGVHAWKFYHPQVTTLQTFSTTQLSDVDFSKYTEVCNGDSVFDSKFVQDKGHNPFTWTVLKQAELFLPLEDGKPTVLGIEADGRIYVLHTFNVLLESSTEHTHYEMRECASREDALWLMGMLTNPDVKNHVKIEIHVHPPDN